MTSSRSQVKFLLYATMMSLTLSLCLAPTQSQGLWLQNFLTSVSNRTGLQGSSAAGQTARSAGELAAVTEQIQQAQAQVQSQVQTQQQEQVQQTKTQQQQQQQQQTSSEYTIAGLRPSNIASLLNTVSETGFSYFNVQDQCRSRTACDMGFMLYKKLNFIHNWIIRATVRTLVDGRNMYAQSWNQGMMGRNCTLSYPACHQSPLESLMNVAMMGGFFNYN